MLASVCLWSLKSPFSTQLSVLTLDFDRKRLSTVVEHMPSSPQLFKRSWKAPLYIKTTNTFPATSSNMTRVRQRWPQQCFSRFDAKMPECLFTWGSLFACLWSDGAAVWCAVPPEVGKARREAAILAALVRDTRAEWDEFLIRES